MHSAQTCKNMDEIYALVQLCRYVHVFMKVSGDGGVGLISANSDAQNVPLSAVGQLGYLK